MDTLDNHRDVDTSVEAAAIIAPFSSRLRALVHRTLCDHPAGLTVDEACAITGCARYSLQPRFTELRHMAMIRDTGMRRENASGARAIVWRATLLDRRESASRVPLTARREDVAR